MGWGGFNYDSKDLKICKVIQEQDAKTPSNLSCAIHAHHQYLHNPSNLLSCKPNTFNHPPQPQHPLSISHTQNHQSTNQKHSTPVPQPETQQKPNEKPSQ